MSDMTLREHLEAIRDRETTSWNFTSEHGVSKCPCYEDSRANIWNAVAALNLTAEIEAKLRKGSYNGMPQDAIAHAIFLLAPDPEVPS